MAEHRTIAAPVAHEIEKVKGSRFLAYAFPIRDAAEADAHVAALRAQHPGATHHCFAWRIDDDRFRWSDDGEPGGTAGRPLHNQLLGHELSHVLVVVVRWFGGTKLGTGPLARAYGEAAGAVLERAEVVTWRDTARLVVTVPWELVGAVQAVVHAFALTPEVDYAAEVRFTLSVPTERRDDLRNAVSERTSGRAQIVDA